MLQKTNTDISLARASWYRRQWQCTDRLRSGAGGVGSVEQCRADSSNKKERKQCKDCTSTSVPMSTNQFPCSSLLSYVRVTSQYSCMTRLHTCCTFIFKVYLSCPSSDSSQQNRHLLVTNPPTPPTASITACEHGQITNPQPCFATSSCRLARHPTLTRSTTPSGSETGEVPPTFLISPPTTCGTFERHE